MSDYIKREDAQRALVHTLKDAEIDTACNEQDWYCQGLMDAGVAIDNVPSADVEPVRHGHWVADLTNPYRKHYVCSECGVGQLFISNYCPNCGAKMYGEEQENERSKNE